jgi:hypothetical protein
VSVFTCLWCQQNYTVDVEMERCPLCDWERARDVTKPKPYSRDCLERMLKCHPDTGRQLRLKVLPARHLSVNWLG